MAMTQQEQNHVARAIDLAAQMVHIKQELDVLRAEWDQNDFFNLITDDDLSGIPAYAHLTQSELAAGLGALTGVRDYLGDYISGQITNLVKLRG